MFIFFSKFYTIYGIHSSSEMQYKCECSLIILKISALVFPSLCYASYVQGKVPKETEKTTKVHQSFFQEEYYQKVLQQIILKATRKTNCEK